MQNFRLNVYAVYLFHRHYDVLLGPVFQEVKGLIICLCTRSEENLFACKISSLVLLQLLSYASS